jgi:HAE1 family hydrophobic/amphiphilic exporter-1
VLAINTLPTSQFPEIAPPVVMVSASYPGASAKVLTESVLIPLEQAINGVWGMRYMTSDATSAGEANIQIVFNLGTDPDQALVQVNTRIAQVLNRLPVLVQREGVIVNRIMNSMLMYVNLYSKDKNADMKFLFNFAGVNMIPGIATDRRYRTGANFRKQAICYACLA